MNKKEAINFIDGVIHQLFNHGWAEDYQNHMEYNDYDKVRHVLELALEGDGKKLNEYIDRESWDEEADWKMDDGGLSSFAIEVGKLMRKYKLLTDEKRPMQTAKIHKSVSFSYKCPHCGARRSTDEPKLVTECGACENPLTLEE